MGDSIYIGSAKAAELHALLAPTVAGLGLALAGVEHVARARRSLVRLYIEPVDGQTTGPANGASAAADEGAEAAYAEGGVTLDDCARVSRQVGALLDVHDPVSGEYDLEVSSPGVDRLLFLREHFERFAGALVKVRTHVPQGGRRQFSGRLLGVTGDSLSVLDEATAERFELPMPGVSMARVVPEW